MALEDGDEILAVDGEVCRSSSHPDPNKMVNFVFVCHFIDDSQVLYSSRTNPSQVQLLYAPHLLPQSNTGWK